MNIQSFIDAIDYAPYPTEWDDEADHQATSEGVDLTDEEIEALMRGDK